ncbi:MAG: aminotransferase class V-fold PLP-dependent enzyme [Candidatus Hodarchaeales archaeon]|jgi:selenocysteine lyase/cysteine desulfurase
MTSLNDFRNEMPVTDSYIYFNHASIGPNPKSTTKIMEDLVSSKKNGVEGIDWDPIMTQFKTVRSEISQLINSSNKEIALSISTAHGISQILSSMDWSKKDDKGIIINDLEFTSNSFPYQQISKKFGIPLYVIKSKKKNQIDIIDIDDIKEQIENSSVNVIGISHVQFLNGFAIDLEKITKMAHEYGVLVLVDAIQSIGALNVDVKKTGIDFLAAGGYKWCLGPLSTGFMYIKQELINSLEPMFVGPTSDKKPMDFQHHEFNPQDSALKFHGAMYTYSAGLGESIKLLNNVGINNIESKIKKLVEYISEEFITNIPNSQIVSPIRKEGSGILTIKLPENIKLEGLDEKLTKEYNVSISLRSGGIRFSPHAYNTEEEIDSCISVIKKIIN